MSEKKKPEAKRAVAVRFDPATIARMEKIAARRKITVSDLIRDVVATGLKGMR